MARPSCQLYTVGMAAPLCGWYAPRAASKRGGRADIRRKLSRKIDLDQRRFIACRFLPLPDSDNIAQNTDPPELVAEAVADPRLALPMEQRVQGRVERVAKQREHLFGAPSHPPVLLDGAAPHPPGVP